MTGDSTLRTRIRPLSDVSLMMEQSMRGLAAGDCQQGLQSFNTTDNNKDKESAAKRLVVVRYFLDRPGYGLHNSVARLWFYPPSVCTSTHVQLFLKQQGIALPGLLVEVYLDKFESFMVVEGCEASGIEWDFENTTYANPGVLNIRLTDLQHAQAGFGFENSDPVSVSARHSTAHTALASNSMDYLTPDAHTANLTSLPKACSPHEIPPPPSSKRTEHANATPLGLFSFSVMVGLETGALMISLFPGSVEASFRLAWGPYMFFVGGLLQVIVGTLQVFRNNLYGATAFLGFGCIWFANGAIVILETYIATADTQAASLVTLEDPVGDLIRTTFLLAFSFALLKQTFVMSKLSTTLIALLCLKLFAQAGRTIWNDDTEWAYLQFVVGWITAVFAFYVFLVELTNNIYQRNVFSTFKWSEKNSPEEAFGAAGRIGTLHSKAALLRQANFAGFDRRIRTTMPQYPVKQE